MIRNLLLCLSVLLVLPGCSGYRLGSMLPKDIQSVFVPLAKNDTAEPQLESDVTRAILQEIQRDGSLKIRAEEDADSILYVTISKVELKPLSFESDNRARPNEYRFEVRVKIRLVRTSDETILVRDNRVEGETVFELIGDLTSSKQQVFPELSEDLAKVVVSKVTEAWPDTA